MYLSRKIDPFIFFIHICQAKSIRIYLPTNFNPNIFVFVFVPKNHIHHTLKFSDKTVLTINECSVTLHKQSSWFLTRKQHSYA